MWKRRATIITLGIATGALVTSMATASVPDPDGKIYACRNTAANGIVRVIDKQAGQTCSPSVEKPLNWNQQGVPGPIGATGPQGPRGETGAQGPSRIDTYVVTVVEDVPVHTQITLMANCNDNGYDRVLGGGFNIGQNDNVFIATSQPSDAGGQGWRVDAYNNDTHENTFYAYAICFRAFIG